MTRGRDAAWTAAAMLAVLLACASGAGAAGPLACGSGVSTANDAKDAGTEAATKAKAALGDATPKLVLVHYSGPLMKQSGQVVAGVVSVFDPALVYGCGAYASLTQETNGAKVAVLALGGEVAVTTAVAETKGKQDDVACGARIGEQLKDAAAKGPGRVLILFGACHIPRNAEVVKGVSSVLGATFPIVGAAAYKDDIYVQGKLAKSSNLGILLTGSFGCGFGLNKDMSREGLIASATDTFRSAIGGHKDKVALVLCFDCGGRRGAMQKHQIFAQELEAMKAVAGDAPIFGFYGSGEMGCKAAGQAPTGVGYHISACAIVAE